MAFESNATIGVLLPNAAITVVPEILYGVGLLVTVDMYISS